MQEEQKKYYANLEYNKSKRVKFFALFGALIVTMGLVIGSFIALGQYGVSIISALVLIFIGMLIPQTLRNYPVKTDEPLLVVNGREITVGKDVFRAQDIENVRVSVELAPVSKLDSENKEFLKNYASKMPEDECFGTLELTFKPAAKVSKGEVRVVTVEDCLGALVAMVDAGVKHYSITFSLKKFFETAKFSVTKTEIKQQKLSDVSKKDRLKQIM